MLSEEAVNLFIAETQNALKEKLAAQRPELEQHNRKLAQTEKQIGNIMAAIRAGIITPANKA